MQRLFNAGKIGLFLDGFSPGTETRAGEDVKIVTLTLRVQPFDATLAVSVDEGLGEDNNVRASLFELSTVSPKAYLERVNLSLGCPRQTLLVHAAPDAPEARIALAQVKIHGVYARKQKDVDGYAFVFKASFGPVGRDEWEFLNHWYLAQQFVTFQEAEPSLAFDDEAVSDEKPVSRPAPMWDDGDQTESTALAAPESEEAREKGSRATAKRGRKKTTKHDPEAEKRAQMAAGKAAAVAH